MTNVKGLKRVIKEHSDIFGPVNGNYNRYESKLWFLTGILNGYLHGKNCLKVGEFIEVSDYITELLKEEN